jgi:uncharacterized coiled-coil protein SlyX
MKGGQDEFRELSDMFDSMLEQLESHVAEQQRFVANASHELGQHQWSARDVQGRSSLAFSA